MGSAGFFWIVVGMGLREQSWTRGKGNLARCPFCLLAGRGQRSGHVGDAAGVHPKGGPTVRTHASSTREVFVLTPPLGILLQHFV